MMAALIWAVILMLPWRPWTAHPFLDAAPCSGNVDLKDVTVLIPARNEASLILRTLQALKSQGQGLNIVLIDDQSVDDTAKIARTVPGLNLRVMAGAALAPGWSGKLWALEQGRRQVKTPYTLLMDADIELAPGIIATALNKMIREGLALLSLMAELRMASGWERLLMPAFVYFFKLLYPFRLANSQIAWFAAAAGGFILLKTRTLEEIGGFGTIKGALIDDCALAYRVKSQTYRTWMGLTHSVRSFRSYGGLREIWNMVARTAFTQLRYSLTLLLLCTALMLIAFFTPFLAIIWGAHLAFTDGVLITAAVVMMMITYLPVLGFYGQPRVLCLTLPLVGTLYLAMTWSSAIRYWRGETAQWRGRTYGREI
jgi:hopene-associated glycosyltransferase HpnB